MSIVAMSPIVATNYVPTADNTNDNKTSFKLKPLNGMQGLEVMQELRFDENRKPLLTAKGLQLALKYGLDGWENFLDESGQPVFFTINNINRVRTDILAELASEIINKSALGGG